MSDFFDALEHAFGDRAGSAVPLGPMTTFRVGGVADWLVQTHTAEEVLLALRLASGAAVTVTMLGGGSNVLVSDAGVRGLVIRPRGGAIRQVDATHIRADAAVTINGLVRWTIAHGCAGLEAWAGTPGTVGGGIYGNAHFREHLLGDLVEEVALTTRDGNVIDVPHDALAFAYDRSRLQTSGEILLSAVFVVSSGNPALLRATARASLAFRKRTQPLSSPSAGCVFQNPEPGRDSLPDGMPWSAGALVDRAGLKGMTIGGARVSPIHGNFIINDGTATAREIRQLINRCRDVVRERFGVELREEIVYLGNF